MHLVLLYEAVAPARAEAVTTAAYWLGNHQPIKGCVSLLRRPRDPEYGAMLWALTMRLPGGLQVHDGIPDCPTLIVFPGVPIPPMPPGRWSILENVAGPMYVFQAEEAGG